MDNDITDFLSLEIKRDLADRYFSFRKLIEEDNAALDKDIADSISTEQKIVIDLARIYILLRDKELINKFITISGLQQPFFYDEYMVTSPTIKYRLFHDIKIWGITRGGRFKKMFLECYDDLARHVEQFREKYAKLADNQAMLEETIDLFYRKNDISSILGFLRGMESSSPMGGGLEGKIDTGFNESMTEKMRIKPPPPLKLRLPMFPPMVPEEQIKGQLKELASEALKFHPDDFLH